MRRQILVSLIFSLCLVGLSEQTRAAPLTVTSYSMTNGATGSYNYRDFTYLPCTGNACDTTSAALSGGTGKLTDGVSPSGSWYMYGWSTPWVGWYTAYREEINPIVTFNFGSTVDVTSVTVWVDNTIGSGGVSLPSSVSIDGNNFLIPPDSVDPSARAYTFSGLNLVGESVDVQFFQGLSPWIMVGEVTFNGTSGSPVPVPSTLLLLGSGLLGVAGVAWRKRKE